MRFFAIILAFGALFTLAAAQAAEFWSDHHYKGNYFSAELMNVCIDLNRWSWGGVMSSYVVHKGYSCKFYTDRKCKNIKWIATGRKDGTLDGDSNDAIWSYKCKNV